MRENDDRDAVEAFVTFPFRNNMPPQPLVVVYESKNVSRMRGHTGHALARMAGCSSLALYPHVAVVRPQAALSSHIAHVQRAHPKHEGYTHISDTDTGPPRAMHDEPRVAPIPPVGDGHTSSVVPRNTGEVAMKPPAKTLVTGGCVSKTEPVHRRCTLICYAYHASPRSDYNLAYFVRRALCSMGDAHVIITVNGHACGVELPTSPNLTVLRRPNEGYDFGAHAHSLTHASTHLGKFTHHIFLNCGTFGPCIPVYIPSDYDWTRAFTDKLTAGVGIVGTSIVCLSKTVSNVAGPHVEGFAFALSESALTVALQAGGIFTNHPSKYNAIVFGEYGLSRTLRDAGLGLASLQYRYSHTNWDDAEHWSHNDYKHPSRLTAYGGISMHPFEVVFHKWDWSSDPSSRGFVNFETVEYINQVEDPLPP